MEQIKELLEKREKQLLQLKKEEFMIELLISLDTLMKQKQKHMLIINNL